MNGRPWTLTLAFTLILGGPGGAQSPSQAVPELIHKLASASFAERERACRELATLGTSALDALRQARNHADAETKGRIAALIQQAEEKALAQRLLAPKEIRFNLKDATLDEALAELSKASGYTVQFQGDRSRFEDKKFTLDTGVTTFWQALDQLCHFAGLSEENPSRRESAGTNAARFPALSPGVSASAAACAQPDPTDESARGEEWSSFAGAARTQLSIQREEATHTLLLHFLIGVEPSLLRPQLNGSPRIDQALANGRALAVMHEKTNAIENVREVQVRLEEGKLPIRHLQQLTGTLSLQCELAQETLVRVEKILDAAGKTFPGAAGGSLKIDSLRKLGNDVEMQMALENLTPNLFGQTIFIKRGGNIVIRGNAMQRIGVGDGPINGADPQNDLPELLDAKGKKFQIMGVSQDNTNFVDNSWSRSVTVLYRPHPEQAAASALIYVGRRPFTVAVPFRFENIEVP